jgi:phage terminase large subunit-like protein
VSTSPTTRQWITCPADEKAADAGCYFDLDAADHVRRFMAKVIRQSKGEFAGKPLELLDWQWQQIVGPLYGWKRPNGRRRFRRASVWVAKKNGKSTLAAGLILYGLVADSEAGAEVYGAAADRNQAGIIFNEVAAMVRQSPALEKRLDVNKTLHRVVFQEANSFYQVLSKDSRKSGHGINSHLSVVDELHVVNRELYDTLRYAGAARRQPLQFEISTAGNDKTSLGYDRYVYAKRLLKGEIEDPETLAVVYEAAEPAQWEQPEQWKKANPSLGVTIPLDGFKSDFLEAKNGSPADQANFKQLRLNLWQDAIFAWLPLEAWDACAADLEPSALEGKTCWGAFDLASKMDLTAWALVFDLGDGEFALLTRFIAPCEADNRRQKENRSLLKPWMDAGHIVATEGNVADYDVIEGIIREDCERFGVERVYFDPWNATGVVNHLQAEGIALVEFGQTIKNYNAPMRELERLVMAGKLKHDGNPVMRWMVAHTCARKDPSGNVRPDKEKSSDHIDGVCSTIMALQGALAEGGGSVYETKGIELL